MQGKHEGSGIVFPPRKILFSSVGLAGSLQTQLTLQSGLPDYLHTGCGGLGFIAQRVGAYGLELEVQRSIKEAVW